MIDEKDFNQIRNYVIQILPQLLRTEPEIVATIEDIIAQQFPRRDEFNRLLEEVKLLRESMDRRFEQVDRRLELLREEMERRFEQMDRRFELLREEMERRFEQVDQRFEQVDKRLEQIDQRFEQVDKRLEQIDQRFEQIDQRFEQVDQRFEQVDKRFEEMHQDFLDVKRRLIKVEAGQQTLLNKMTGLDAWLKTTTGNLGTEKGQQLEELFALALGYGLDHPDLKPESIRLRQELIDMEGVAFKKGYITEVDLIAENNQLTVFEIKATAKVSDVDFFALKVEVVQAQNLNQVVQGIFISMGANERVRQRCVQRGLKLLG
jgi:hypothetical protein